MGEGYANGWTGNPPHTTIPFNRILISSYFDDSVIDEGSKSIYIKRIKHTETLILHYTFLLYRYIVEWD